MSGSRPMRIGLICTGNPHDPGHLSGMPHHVLRALEGIGLDVVPLVPPMPEDSPLRGALRTAAAPLLASSAGRALRDRLRSRRQREDLRREAESTHAEQIAQALESSERILRQIADEKLDLLFGICISTALYGLETDLPIVYSSDATARLILDTYPAYEGHSEGYKRACMEFEAVAMSRVAAALFPSRRTLASAIEDHGLPADRARLAPFGSNVVPRADQRLAPEAPSRDHLELLIVAADPVRKQLDLCVEATELLRARGIAATLHSVGPPTARALESAHVDCVGPLRLAESGDRRTHQDLLARSHLMLLPSKGEMFGIAPAEAAHFGRPSLVADVGGLSTVVEHGRTGLVLAAAAGAADYADAIEGLVDDPVTYRAMSAQALDRARGVLNWEAFARSAAVTFEEVLAARRRSGDAAPQASR